MTGRSGSGSDAHLTARLGLGRIAGSILALLLLPVPLLSNSRHIPHRSFAPVGPDAGRPVDRVRVGPRGQRPSDLRDERGWQSTDTSDRVARREYSSGVVT